MELQIAAHTNQAVLIYGHQGYKIELARKICKAFGENTLVVGTTLNRTLKDAKKDTTAIIVSAHEPDCWREHLYEIDRGFIIKDQGNYHHIHPKFVFVGTHEAPVEGASFHIRFKTIDMDTVNVDVDDVTIKIVSDNFSPTPQHV